MLLIVALLHFGAAMQPFETLPCPELAGQSLADALQQLDLPADFLANPGWRAIDVGKHFKAASTGPASRVQMLRYDASDAIVAAQLDFHRELLPRLRGAPFFPFPAKCFRHDGRAHIAFTLPAALPSLLDTVTPAGWDRAREGTRAVFEGMEARGGVFASASSRMLYALQSGEVGLRPLELAGVYGRGAQAYCVAAGWLGGQRGARSTRVRDASGLPQVLVRAPRAANAFYRLATWREFIERAMPAARGTPTWEALRAEREECLTGLNALSSRSPSPSRA